MKMFHRLQWSIVLTVVLNIQGMEAILCNSCQYSAGPLPPNDCVNPTNASLPTVNCSAACSTSVQTYVATGDIYYIARGCNVSGTNSCGEYSGIKKCDYICNDRDLCNDGNYEPPPKTTPEPWTGSTTIITETPGTRDCYSCVYSYHPDATTTCIYDPPAAVPNPKVRCPPDRVCTIFRQWVKGENVVRSFSRSCLPPPNPLVNSCVEDANFITYNTYCTPELCNSGDGMVTCPPPGGGGGGGGDTGKVATIFSSSTGGLIWIATSASVIILSNHYSI